MMAWTGRTKVGMSIGLLLMAQQVHASRISRAGSGTADCPTKAWRVLVVAGEMQANSWCDKNYRRRVRRKQYEDKKRMEREAYAAKKKQELEVRKLKDDKREQERKERIKAREQRHKDQELKRKQELLRREMERKKREEETEARKCRGIANAARCVKTNPGKRSR